MILYTPMQLELVLSGLDNMTNEFDKKASVNGVPVIVRQTGDGKQKIIQLLSTNPADYLRSELYPGTVVNIDG